jgi:hypothetical protein
LVALAVFVGLVRELRVVDTDSPVNQLIKCLIGGKKGEGFLDTFLKFQGEKRQAGFFVDLENVANGGEIGGKGRGGSRLGHAGELGSELNLAFLVLVDGGKFVEETFIIMKQR